MAINVEKIFRVVNQVFKVLSSSQKAPAQRSHRTANPAGTTRVAEGYPGDFTGRVTFEYSPELDGQADPGEVVWSWVPYEEDHTQGKDRPVLVVGRDGRWLLGLMLTSKDHGNGRTQDPDYLDIGTGDWDRQRRESEVKLDRIIRLAPDGIRREGAVLDRRRFERVVKALNER
ncbi:hypothetical protein GCM10027417_08710 [Glutamicibacter endophyticus]